LRIFGLAYEPKGATFLLTFQLPSVLTVARVLATMWWYTALVQYNRHQ
jgi:hypothetical protein